MNIWSSVKKVKLPHGRQQGRPIGVLPLLASKDDRLFARFLVVILTQPEIDLKESKGEFKFAVPLITVYARKKCHQEQVDINLGKYSTTLTNQPTRGARPTPTNPTEGHCQHQPTHQGAHSTILVENHRCHGCSSVYGLRWVKKIRDLADHFLHIVECKSYNFDVVHALFDHMTLAIP